MNFANKISVFRILSVPFFIACLVLPQRGYLRFAALIIFLLAVLSDWVDGYIARKTKLSSKAGLILDPLGDKLLLMSAFIFLYKFPVGEFTFPASVILIVLSRDIIILLGALVIYLLKQDLNVHPSVWGKFTTVFQMLAVIAVLLQWKTGAPFLWQAAVVFTLISGADYIRKGFGILYAPDSCRVSG